MTYVIFWLEAEQAAFREFTEQQLVEALNFAQEKRTTAGTSHVVLSSELAQQVGQRGVDSVIDGKLPNGNKYDWKKRRL
jgi:hypothetical protein